MLRSQPTTQPSDATAGAHLENSANRANYDEINGHLTIIKAKLAKNTDAPPAHLVEDLEDYYERAVQMRQYRITTLEEQLKETNKRAINSSNTVRRVTARLVSLVLVVVVTAVGCMLEILKPGLHARLLKSLPLAQIATHCIVAIVAAAASYAAVRSAVRQDVHNKLD